MRKAIQIAEVDHALHALCDDGTMWCHGGGAGWQLIEAIPQPDDAPEFQEIEPAPIRVPWRPWKHSQDAMWCVEHGTLLVDEVRSEGHCRTKCTLASVGRFEWSMIRAKDAAEALAIYQKRDTVDTVTRKLTIDGASYLYLEDDTVPF